MNELDLFVAALAITDAAQRAAFLERECQGNTALQERIEQLLAANAEAGSFLERTGGSPAAEATSTHARDRLPETEDYGDPTARVGAILASKYKLIEVIGEGGMGSVYMAQQTEPVKRAVAVKVIKAGMDSKAVLARFEAERQALAMMDHPNIARVLDAGTTDGGRPFFVMELVKGVPITQYCDVRKLKPKERLELFVPVCQAIQHAHQKGIIHRDIKPSNVLVAMYDDKPVPKVIDFGVAKAAGQALTDRTLMTGFGAVVGTPEYMSPEQANLNNRDIDTRSDVYSLGVLLYELLTGSTPVDRKSLGKAVMLEILRIVREVEAPKPSHRLSTSDALPSVAANRGTEPAKLSALMKGELDWVVLKALEKDRARRYDSANGLARDIQRYLADEVVEARPPSAGYRLRKFARRNRKSVLTATVILFALVAGVVGTTIGLVRALAAEKLAGEQLLRAEQAEAAVTEQRNATVASEAKAVQEAAIARAVTTFLQQDLLEMADSEVQFSAGLEPDPEVKLRTLLNRAESRVKERFAAQPEVEAAVRNTLGKAFYGVREFARSVEQFEKVLAYRAAHLGPDHTDTLLCMLDLAEVLHGAGRGTEAVPLSEAALQRLKAKLGNDDPLTIRGMHVLACAYLNVGRQTDSLVQFEETYQLMKVKFGPDDPRTLECLGNMPLASPSSAEAVPLLEEALRRKKSKLGPNNPSTLSTEYWLAMQYANSGRVAKALPLCEENFKLRKDIYGANHSLTLRSMGLLARVLAQSGRPTDALRLGEEAWELSKAKLGADHQDTLMYLRELAHSYLLAKQPEKALPLYNEYLDWVGKRYKSDEPLLAKVQVSVGYDYLKFGQFNEAEKVLRACFSSSEKRQPDLWTTFNTKSLLGGALLGQKQYAVAEPLLLVGYEGMKQRENKILPEVTRNTVMPQALDRVIELYTATNKPDEVKRWQAERAKYPPPDPPEKK